MLYSCIICIIICSSSAFDVDDDDIMTTSTSSVTGNGTGVGGPPTGLPSELAVLCRKHTKGYVLTLFLNFSSIS